MRLLFVHDHRFLRGPEDNIYTVGSFPASVWKRYLDAFDEITVVARDGGMIPPGSDLAQSDVPHVEFQLIRDYPLSQRLFNRSGEAFALLEREIARADAVLVRLPSDLGNLAANMANQRNMAWAGEIVGCAWDGYKNHGSKLSQLYAPLAMQRLQRVAAGSEQILYVTRQFLQKRYPTRGKAVGVSDVEIVQLDEAARSSRAERLVTIAQGRQPVFGTVASLGIMSKGVQDVILALKQLRKDGLAPEYRVLGGGNRQPWIERAEQAGVAAPIHFDGTKASGDGVRSWLDEVDVHLQPSYQEGLPRATVEAMSRGCACLGSTAGGLPELLPASRLHAPGDVDALARFIREFASDPGLVRAASAEDLATSTRYLPEALDDDRARFLHDLAKRAASSTSSRFA